MASNGGNGYPSMQVIVTFVVRALVGLFVLILGWNVRSVVQDVQELQASDRTQDRQIITLQVERRQDARKLDDIDEKLEAIRTMLVTGEIRVIPREGG